MLPTENGAIRLFRFSGISVYLHWSWFVIAVLRYQWLKAAGGYDSPVYYIFEILALFGIVLLHEFGHSLACRQVGGVANRIVLWPLGGVAYVQPPPRPGANLWSIAAGPLVNVVLFPILVGLTYATAVPGGSSDVHLLFRSVAYINFGLLVFNILPIYPLDGGQILRSLLWFVRGPARSLMVATIVGFAGIIGVIGLGIVQGSAWIIAIAVFMLLNCWAGLQSARAMLRVTNAPRRESAHCPACGVAP